MSMMSSGEHQSGPPQMQCVEVYLADELDLADHPLPVDGDELSEPPEGATKSARRTFLVSWSLMRPLRLPYR